jgi:hypothetical protein
LRKKEKIQERQHVHITKLQTLVIGEGALGGPPFSIELKWTERENKLVGDRKKKEVKFFVVIQLTVTTMGNFIQRNSFKALNA